MMLDLVILKLSAVRSQIPDSTKQGTIVLVSFFAKILIMSGHGNGFFSTGADPYQFKVQELCQVFLGEGHTAELEFKLSLFIHKKIVLNDPASSMAVGCEVFVYKLVAVLLTKLCFFFQVMVLLTLTAQQLLRRQFLL